MSDNELSHERQRPGEPTPRTDRPLSAPALGACAELRDPSADALEAVFHGMSDGVIVADAEGRVVRFNRAAEAIIGIGPTDAPRAEWPWHYGCYLPDTVTLYPAEHLPLSRALRGEEVNEAEIFIRNDRKPEGVWLSVNARPLRDAAGTLCGGVAVLRDVTAHKWAEAEHSRLLSREQEARVQLESALHSLRASESRFRRLGESNLMGVIVADLSGRILEANDAFLRMVGYTRAELLSGEVRWDALTPPEYRDRDEQAVRMLRAQGVAPTWEKEYVRKDGSRVPVLVGVAMLEGPGELCICFVLDVSGHKRLERRLVAKNAVTHVLAEARTLGEATPRILEAVGESIGWDLGAIWEVDRHANVLRLVDIWTRPGLDVTALVDRSRQTAFVSGVGLPGRVWAKGEPAWIVDVTRDDNFPRAPAAARAGLHAGFGFPIRAGGQVTGVIEFFHREVRPPDEQLLAMIGSLGSQIGQFIARKRMEEALATERNQLRTLMDNVPDYIYVKDTQSRFVLSNSAHLESLGASALEEVVGKTNFDFSPSELARAYRADEEQVMRTGQPLLYRQERSVDRAGREKWVLTSKLPLRDGGGTVVGVVGISRDITAIKQAEEAQREAKEAAEAANRAKSAFLASVSHEIRTPLNAIIGMTALILDSDLAVEQREYLEMVQKSAESLLAIINDILDFSKIEAGKMDLDRRAFFLRDTLGDVLETLALPAHQKGLELVGHVAPDVPDRLVGDPGRLRQVLVNLVGNAIKFTEQGEVVVEVRGQESGVRSQESGVRSQEGTSGTEVASADPCPLTPDPCPLTPDPCLLHFAVRDTGPGVAPDQRALIFQPFQQADGSLTRRHGGTGLGLAITARLVEMMEGRVWLESELGRGSTFHFTVRLQRATDPDASPGAGLPPDLDGLRVLVVDDNAASRRALEETLRGWRLEPTSADGGRAALDALYRAAAAGRPFPLLILDVHMPGMDGLTLADRVEQQAELAGPSVVLLTAGTTRGTTAVDRDSSTVVRLSKPVKPADLRKAILMALGCFVPGEEPSGRAAPGARPGRPLRILLAEDNLFNQRLAIGLLEKQGHTVVVTSNGREAVAALEHERFDLVLMDVQMPEMGGLEATARIRNHERRAGGHVPIIAMTAYAMKGDRERCLEAGMDGYVSKPVRAQELFGAIDNLALAGAPAEACRPAASPAEGTLDWAVALDYVGGDESLLRELVAVFLTQGPSWLADLRQARDHGDIVRLKRLAHNLKSATAHFGARAAFEAAFRLEVRAQQGDLAGATEGMAALENEVGRLMAALAALPPAELPVPP